MLTWWSYYKTYLVELSQGLPGGITLKLTLGITLRFTLGDYVEAYAQVYHSSFAIGIYAGNVDGRLALKPNSTCA